MKKGFIRFAMVAGVLAIALLGCQTTKAVTVENAIRTDQTGLAPNGDKLHSTIDFSLSFNTEPAIKSWTVEMVTGRGTVKLRSGTSIDLPETLTWNGRDDAGSPAVEGTYVARLTIEYLKVVPVVVQSQSFILDVSPPTGSLSFAPAMFIADATGAVLPMTITIKGSSVSSRIDSWSIDIFDQDGKAFRSFDGKWSNAEIKWDGKSAAGNWVEPARFYSVQATVRDEYGSVGQAWGSINVSDVAKAAEPEAAEGTVAVTPRSAGFSPNADKIMDTMKFALAYGAPQSVRSWKLEILDSNQKVQRTLRQDGADLPRTASWDGKNDAGNLVPEAAYTARLSIDYGSAFKPGSATSSSFRLVTTPPTGFVTLSEALFSPMDGALNITLSVNASSRQAKIDSWRMEIYDPEYHLFQTFTEKWPLKSAVWDGKDFNGDLVLSAEDYPVSVKVRDEFGNVGVLTTVVPVDILVEKVPTGFRILSSRIFFKPFTADYQDVKPELAAQNMKRLDALAEKLRKFPSYKINLVGHAVKVYWDNKAVGDVEQRDVLLPLSKDRADAVKKALVARGLNPLMFTTEGVGASDQIVPDSNLADHWQNRRVAFFIMK
jgi:outer membrane protein OmpA-like peptidoglycan-associated protein/flagellar hook assembly protein FlgD